MTVLGIESTAHTCSIGIVDEGAKVLALAGDMYKPPKGGIHPREAANHHVEMLPVLLERALAEAHVSPKEIDGIAFAQGPGLGPCLRAGATVARALSLAWDRPLLPVNHCVSHIEIARVLSGLDDPMLLYASGGNTQVIAYGRGRYRVLGETIDVGIGNFLDKLWIALGGTFPGGPQLEAEARKGSSLYPLPYSVHGMDVAFSGLLTASLALANQGVARADLAFSVETTAYAMLTEITERALAHRQMKHVVLGGGVACNERLRYGPRDGRRTRRHDVRSTEVPVRRQRRDDRLDRRTRATQRPCRAHLGLRGRSASTNRQGPGPVAGPRRRSAPRG